MKQMKTRWKKTTIISWTFFCLIAGFAAATLFDPISAPEAQTNPGIQNGPLSFTQLAKKASPSVVNISAVKVIKGGEDVPSPFGPDDPFRDFFDRFFKDQMPRQFKQQSL